MYTSADLRREMRREERKQERLFLAAEAKEMASWPLREGCDCCTYRADWGMSHAKTEYTETPIWKIALTGLAIIQGLLALISWGTYDCHPIFLLLKICGA